MSLLSLQFSTVKLSSRWHLCARKSPYAPHPVSQKYPQRCLWNGPNVRLIDGGPLSSFQWRLSSASFVHASLLRAIDGVMSLALISQIVSQAPQHFGSSEKQAICEGCFARQSIWFPITLSCPGQYTHRSFRKGVLITTAICYDHSRLQYWCRISVVLLCVVIRSLSKGRDMWRTLLLVLY